MEEHKQQQQQQQQQPSQEEKKRGGGIAWSGSLVGSQNPNNLLGYRDSFFTSSSTTLYKRYKSFQHDTSSTSHDTNLQGGEQNELPSSVVIQFQNRKGETVGTTMDISTLVNVDSLSSLIHSILYPEEVQEDKITPYSFFTKVQKKALIPNPSQEQKQEEGEQYVDDIEITSTLADFLLSNTKHHTSTEDVLTIIYQPLALFRVRPVTRCTNTMTGHTEAILHVSYSPNGLHLASGGGDTTVRFWDVFTCLPKQNCLEHKNHVLCTAWSPDGKLFASADKNGVLILWDPMIQKKKNKKTNNTVFGAEEPRMDDSTDTNRTTTNTSAEVTTKTSANAMETTPCIGKIKAHSKYITSMAWEPLHKSKVGFPAERLVTASKDGLAKIWNVRTKSCEATLAGHVDSVECVKWGGEGLIYTASRDRTIKVWNADPHPTQKDVGKLVKTLQGHGHRVNTLALSSDYVLRTGPFDHTCQPFASLEDARQAAIQRYSEFSGGEPERLISGSDDYTLFLWHPKESKHPIKRMTGHQNLVNHIAFSPDGRYVASASFDKKVKIWNGRSGDFITTLNGHVGAVYQVAWSGDSRFLVSASKDSTAKLWEIPSGKNARETLPGHADEVYALDWSPNGSSVATGSKDRTIKIWKH